MSGRPLGSEMGQGMQCGKENLYEREARHGKEDLGATDGEQAAWQGLSCATEGCGFLL